MKTANIFFRATVFLIIAVSFTSCAQNFYQIYEVEAENLESNNEKLIFCNDDCEIIYNLWYNAGNLSFLFKNKTNQDIYIDMTRSFFIRNGIAYDYYSDTEHTKTATSIASANASLYNQASESYSKTAIPWYPINVTRGIQVTSGAGASYSESISTRESKYVCIPAKSAKEIISFNISDYVYYECGNNKFNLPIKSSETKVYTQSNTPLTFRNRITYFFESENANMCHHIDNNFWIKSLTNYNQTEIIKNTTSGSCKDKYTKITKTINTQEAANRFYNLYNN